MFIYLVVLKCLLFVFIYSFEIQILAFLMKEIVIYIYIYFRFRINSIKHYNLPKTQDRLYIELLRQYELDMMSNRYHREVDHVHQ